MGVTHKDPGQELTYAEYIATDSHVGGGTGNALVIAAADTPATLKARADYTCAGTSSTGGDQTTINTALGIAKTVILCPGTFWLSGAIVLASNKSLLGSGPGTTVKAKNSMAADFNLISGTSIDGVLIADMVIDGNRANETKDISCIYFSAVTHSKITRCHIKGSNREAGSGSGPAGVQFTGSDYNEISLCRFTDHDHNNIFFYQSDYNRIIGNYSGPCLDTGSDALCIDGEDGAEDAVAGSCYNVISGNVCDETGGGSSSNAVTVENQSNYNVVSGNVILGISGDSAGIYVYKAKGNKIIGNEIQNAGYAGVWIRGGTTGGNSPGKFTLVEGNHIKACKYGIFLDSTYGVVSQNSIIGNVVMGNNEHGIYIKASSNNSICNNSVLGNGLTTNDTYSGIYLDGDSNLNNIQGNFVRFGDTGNQHKYGIDISASTCDANFVTNNDLYNGGHTNSIHDAGTTTNTTAGNRTGSAN